MKNAFPNKISADFWDEERTLGTIVSVRLHPFRRRARRFGKRRTQVYNGHGRIVVVEGSDAEAGCAVRDAGSPRHLGPGAKAPSRGRSSLARPGISLRHRHPRWKPAGRSVSFGSIPHPMRNSRVSSRSLEPIASTPMMRTVAWPFGRTRNRAKAFPIGGTVTARVKSISPMALPSPMRYCPGQVAHGQGGDAAGGARPRHVNRRGLQHLDRMRCRQLFGALRCSRKARSRARRHPNRTGGMLDRASNGLAPPRAI